MKLTPISAAGSQYSTTRDNGSTRKMGESKTARNKNEQGKNDHHDDQEGNDFLDDMLGEGINNEEKNKAQENTTSQKGTVAQYFNIIVHC